MRIAVVHNPAGQGSAAGDWLARSRGTDGATGGLAQAAELGVLRQVELVRTSLAAAGHEVEVVATDDAGELCRALERRRPDLIFNCCEAFAGRSALEMAVAGLYDLLAIPYTGSPPLTLGLALQKPLSKAVLAAHGVATPASVVLAAGQDPRTASQLCFPLIVKPAGEDASIGIDDGSVVCDLPALSARAAFVWREFAQPAMVEEFIAGREFNVSLIAASAAEWEVLPIGEITFEQLPPGRPWIVGYEAKWDATAAPETDLVAHCPAALDPSDAERIGALAVAAARAVGLRDYGRVDMRLRERDQALFVLEVNPNPDLSDDAGFMRAARASGRTHASTICEIAARACERSGLATSPMATAPRWPSMEP